MGQSNPSSSVGAEQLSGQALTAAPLSHRYQALTEMLVPLLLALLSLFLEKFPSFSLYSARDIHLHPFLPGPEDLEMFLSIFSLSCASRLL